MASYLGILALCDGKLDQALEYFDQDRASMPEDAYEPIKAVHAYALGRTGSVATAETHFSEIIEAHENASPANYLRVLGLAEECGCRMNTLANLYEECMTRRPGTDDVPHWALQPTSTPIEAHAPGSLPNFRFVDPLGGASYTVEDAIEIVVPNGRGLIDLNVSAPRLTIRAEGDLVAQVSVRPAKGGTPRIGGLLLWHDSRNFLRLDVGTRGHSEVYFSGYIRDEYIIVGRGRLDSDRAVLRLEREGERVRSLCSADGHDWHTAGEVHFPVGGTIDVGVHAIGSIDRVQCPGSHSDGTAIRFEDCQIWQ